MQYVVAILLVVAVLLGGSLVMTSCNNGQVADAINVNTGALITNTDAIGALVESQNRLAKSVDGLGQEMQAGFEHVDQRLDKIEDRLIEVEDVAHDISHAQTTQDNIPVVVVR